MRKEPFAIGDYVHVYNRGNRKQEIVRDANDRWRFLQALYYFNTEITPANPFQSLRDTLKYDFNARLTWPDTWVPQKPIVAVLAFALMENHFHLLLKEIKNGGVTQFMRRIGVGITNRFNTKYKETGRLFQGAYKARRIDKDAYLEYASVYVQVKNPFELYAQQLKKDRLKSDFNVSKNDFEKAFKWAAQYPYCSLGDYMGNRKSPIITKDLLGELYPTSKTYKKLAYECFAQIDSDTQLESLDLEG